MKQELSVRSDIRLIGILFLFLFQTFYLYIPTHTTCNYILYILYVRTHR